MPLGPCPECGNYVALSARSCPGCGNRNFTIRTARFLVTCDSCHGDGKLFDFGIDEFDACGQVAAGCDSRLPTRFSEAM
jgi:ribosomal protein S27E